MALAFMGSAGGEQQPGASPLNANVKIFPDGRARLDVFNRAQVRVTAIAVLGTRTLAKRADKTLTLKSVRFFDSVLDPSGPIALEAGQTHSFSFFGPSPPPKMLRDRSLNVKAVLLFDGSTWGDPEWIATLMQRRKSAYKYEREALEIVTDAKTRGISGGVLLQRLDTIKQRRVAEAKLPEEKQIADLTFTEVHLLVEHSNQSSADRLRFTEPGRQTIDLGVPDYASKRLELRLNRLEASKPSIK
jgi:hypothetical protein